MNGALREIRLLAQAAAAADDEALAKLVRMLDDLADRGMADAVLEPVRSRLRTLRPPRKLRFARLLFLPLDGAVLAPKAWKRGAHAVPRSALGPIAAAVQGAMGEAGAALAARCLGHTTAEPAVIVELGAMLWPEAAEALPATPPPGWQETGLTPQDYAAIAAICRPVWAAGPVLWEAIAAGSQGPPDELARNALAAIVPAGPAPLSAALATLLLRARAPGGVAQIAASLAPSARMVAVEALETMLAQPPPAFGELDPGSAATAALTLAQRLEDLERCSLLTGERQAKVHAFRRAADQACRAGYQLASEEQVLLPATRLAAAEKVDDLAVAAMEAGARKLRLLEAAGRKLGSAGAYDKAVRELTGKLTELGARMAPEGGGLHPIDIARSIEILAGPEVAEQALHALRHSASAGTP